MKKLTEKQRELIKLGEKMKEIIRLSEGLTYNGHPIIDEWVSQVRILAYKSSDSYILNSFSSYKFAPHKNELFDILIYLRRVLKEEGIFSQEFVE